MAKDLKLFFKANPVFKSAQMRTLYGDERKQTQANLIQYHKKKGHILKIQDALYAVVPEGVDPNNFQVDPVLLSSKLTDDAVIGYHSALSYWGNLHSIRNVFVYLTNKNIHKNIFQFQGLIYQSVLFPKKLRDKDQQNFDVSLIDRLGGKILITNRERTFVDVLDRTDLLGNDWEEIYRSLESIAYLDIDKVIEYLFLLENKTTLAKVGFFLDTFKDQWQIDESYLKKLYSCIPKQPVYFDRKAKEKQKLVSKWNIIVPISIISKNWEEPYADI